VSLPVEPFGRNALTDFVHLPGTVAVRNDAGVRHAVTKGVLALLNLAWVDARRGYTNANFAASRMRVRHLSDPQNLRGRPLLLVPRRSHSGSSWPACSLTMYSAYQSGQFGSACPVRASC
jgi:hypothetical protein